jgi:hypothetical protein
MTSTDRSAAATKKLFLAILALPFVLGLALGLMRAPTIDWFVRTILPPALAVLMAGNGLNLLFRGSLRMPALAAAHIFMGASFVAPGWPLRLTLMAVSTALLARSAWLIYRRPDTLKRATTWR